MKTPTVLVATDLSGRSDFAEERAARIAANLGATLHVLHVVDDALPAAVTRELRGNIKGLLEETVASFQSEKLENVQVAIRLGSVWKTILAVADEIAADLIVLGSHRFRGIAELFRGTTLERIARSARVPVLMVTAEPKTDYRHVAVGIDFSPAALTAVTDTVTFAPEARFSLVSTYHVVSREIIHRAEPGDSDTRAEKGRIEGELKGQMSDFLKSCPERPQGYQPVFLEGGAADSLCRFAAKEGADLISVGSHGRSWITRAFIGSTAATLLSGAPCDVLVAKP